MSAPAERVRRGFGREARIAWLALLLGLVLVAALDLALAPHRYAYSGDSASYIEMARSLRSEGRALVTPWGLTPGDRDAVPQPLFPPGFAVLVAALTPLAGVERSAALWPSRIAAALLPVLLVLLWRGTAAPPTLLLVGLWVLASPGVRAWQYLAYSDVTALALAIAALGVLARGLAGPGRLAPAGWVVAGLLAGACYTVRNAGLAVLAATFATLGYAWLRGYAGARPIALAGLGALVPLGALAAYDRAMFGTLWPYTMPPSARPWTLNVGDLAEAQLDDAALPWRLAERLGPTACLLALGAAFALGALAWWRTRAERATHLRLTLLGAYAVGGAVLLVLSRSRFEWGNLIDERNTLQYSFALVLAALLAAGVLLPARARRLGACVLVACLAARGLVALRETVLATRAAPDLWLELDRDARVMGAARALPANVLVASNAGVLFRIGAPRAVRQLDVGGDDADFAGSLRLLADAAAPRPAAFLLVCNEWTWRFSACQGRMPEGAPRCAPLRAAPPVAAVCEAGAGGPPAPAGSGTPTVPDPR